MEPADKEKAPKPKDKRQSILIAAVAALILFIAVVICLTMIIILRQGQQEEPKEMVLRNPSDDIVVLGTTRQDLEQAMGLTKKWVHSTFKGDAEAGRENLEDMGQLLISQRVVEVFSGTGCLLLESQPTMCLVQITEGPRNGQTFWVYREFVGYPENEEGSFEGLFALFCARYLIIGFICCVGIYFLRIKSILLQIVCFILSFFILNLLLVRIVAHFMF